jgi:hypothetical protein
MRQPLARDTAPAAEQRQILFFQQRQPRERLAITFDLIAFAVAMSRAAIRKAHPELDALEQARLFATLQYGPAYATRVRQAPTIEGVMSIPLALLPVTRILSQLGIAYYVGGSIASTAYSLPRATYDIDLAADIQPHHVVPFAAALEAEYYIDRSAILDAIAHRDREAAFNITHHATGINIDIFVTADRPFDRSRYQRAQDHTLPGTTELVKLASPEDVILNKLLWFRQDGIESEKQWRDVASIIRVQDTALDLHYLQTWAATLDLGELLDAALRGETPPPPRGSQQPEQGQLF